jgi:hypothetical protein
MANETSRSGAKPVRSVRWLVVITLALGISALGIALGVWLVTAEQRERRRKLEESMKEPLAEFDESYVRPVVYCQEDRDCSVGMSCLGYYKLPYRTCEFTCSLKYKRCPINMECYVNEHVILADTRGTCEPVVYRKAP